jgi:two-component system response regulator VicR
MPGERILVVDDEAEVAELLRDYLEREGYRTALAFDGESALRSFAELEPDLVVLDLMLPGIDGLEVCRFIRSRSDLPILMLSAKGSDMDKILGLGLGADDYVVKPFSPGELVARVKAHLRRHAGMGRRPRPIVYDGLEIDREGRRVSLDGRELALSAMEFDLLAFLASRPGQALSREQLFEQVWGAKVHGELNTVTVHVRKIREKLGDDPEAPRFIQTVWGLGYRFAGGKGR